MALGLDPGKAPVCVSCQGPQILDRRITATFQETAEPLAGDSGIPVLAQAVHLTASANTQHRRRVKLRACMSSDSKAPRT